MDADVIVVGAGNAALCAALSAREQGADVLVLESAPKAERGGNTAFTAGAMRVAYKSVDDLLTLVSDLTAEQIDNTHFGSYPAEAFFDDMVRVSEHRTDPELAMTLAEESLPTLQWMRSKGVRFAPIYGRQAFKVDGKFAFWGGLVIETSGGGPGLVDALVAACEEAGVRIRYDARARQLVRDDEGVHGVEALVGGRSATYDCGAIVLACGGFEADLEWRVRYLGPGWDLAKVRGSRFNRGDGIRMGLEAGSMPWGHWSGCHAVGWDRNAPAFGDLTVGDGFQKHSYPFGIMVNALGRRFVDEGADFRNYTYAKYGREILQQPQQFAWQIFDAKVTGLLRDEYRIRQVTRVTADTLEGLADKLDGVDAAQFLRTVRQFNDAVDMAVPFNPNVKDGRRTMGLDPDKSNWANRIDDPPFEAYQVTCGITFTFGGLRITAEGQVLDTVEQPVPGLYAAGEMAGGLFYFNYPGGSGLTAGSVFGRRAGAAAAQHAGGTPDRRRTVAASR